MTNERAISCEVEGEFELLILVDENENETEFFHIDTLEVNGNKYFVLLPASEEEPEDSGAIVLKLSYDEDGEETLLEIEDDEEWEQVEAAWLSTKE